MGVTLKDLRVKLFMDADKAQIREMASRAWIRDFTTNPSLLKAAQVSDGLEQLDDIAKRLEQPQQSGDTRVGSWQRRRRWQTDLSAWVLIRLRPTFATPLAAFRTWIGALSTNGIASVLKRPRARRFT
jgi:hypothetical protein